MPVTENESAPRVGEKVVIVRGRQLQAGWLMSDGYFQEVRILAPDSICVVERGDMYSSIRRATPHEIATLFPPERKCATCVFSGAGKQLALECRRRSAGTNGWPLVKESDFCGEHDFASLAWRGRARSMMVFNADRDERER